MWYIIITIESVLHLFQYINLGIILGMFYRWVNSQLIMGLGPLWPCGPQSMWYWATDDGQVSMTRIGKFVLESTSRFLYDDLTHVYISYIVLCVCLYFIPYYNRKVGINVFFFFTLLVVRTTKKVGNRCSIDGSMELIIPARV